MLISLLFMRLGVYMRRVMRHLPAEIPPWHIAPASTRSWRARPPIHSSSEAFAHVVKDPFYVQDVLKPRLRQLVAYRLSGSPDVPFEALDEARLARVSPALLEFLSRHEETSLWAKYHYRQQRVHDVFEALQDLEAI